MALQHYSTIEDLQELLNNEIEEERRENNFLENTLKIAIAGEFRATELEVYGYPDANPQYFFFLEYSEEQCPYIIVRNPLSGHNLNLLKEAVPLVIAKTRDLRCKHETLLVAGDAVVCDEFERHLSSSTNDEYKPVPSLGFTGVFYMTKEQRETLLEMDFVAPAGFSFEPVDVDRDADTIHRLWKTALNIEVTKNRLRFLPSMCTRTEKGELVGWSMAARFGQVTNLYVLPEYRNLGLGKTLELSVAKEFASRGMRVFKYVETTNTPVYEGSLRSPLWTLWTYGSEDNNESKTPMLHTCKRFEKVAK